MSRRRLAYQGRASKQSHSDCTCLSGPHDRFCMCDDLCGLSREREGTFHEPFYFVQCADTQVGISRFFPWLRRPRASESAGKNEGGGSSAGKEDEQDRGNGENEGADEHVNAKDAREWE